MSERLALKKDNLRRYLPKGGRVYTIRVNKPGHWFILLAVSETGRIVNITADAREVCGESRREEWHKTGYNYNHAASCVEDLSYALYDEPNALMWDFLN